MENHYATNRIINIVSNQTNDQMTIQRGPANEYPTEFKEPADPKSFAKELNKLFKSGAEIILETNQGFDDEGQNCYQAYVIKLEHKEHFYHFYDLNYERNGKMLWQLCIMEYILANPSHIITIWAGAY